MRFFVTVDGDSRLPDMLFRTADGGPPFERWNAADDTWVEEPSLVDYFTGDAEGAVEFPTNRLAFAQAAVLANTDGVSR